MEKLNFDCQAIQADGEVWKEKDLTFPLIAHVLVEQKYFHYVVVSKVKDNVLFIADPAKGL